MSLEFSNDVFAQKFLDLCQDVAQIKTSQDDTRARLFGEGGQPGAIHYLKTEIDTTNAVVAKHTKALNFYRGMGAVLAFLWSAAVAFGAVILGKHH